MIRYGIIDASIKEDAVASVGASWLRWEMKRLALRETDPQLADVLLCTMASYIQGSTLRRKLKKANRKATIVLGGGCSATPAAFEDIADVICVGEGRNFIRTLSADGLDAAKCLPEAWIRGDDRYVIPSCEFPWDMPPVKDSEGTVRVMVSRGCHRACLFCLEGWWRQYQMTPNLSMVERASNQYVRQGVPHLLVTNDAAYDVPHLLNDATRASISFEAIEGLLAKGFVRNKMSHARIGVEGISERLRKAVGKPMTIDRLASVTSRLLEQGVNVTWYFVVGLPGETETDWRELRDLSDSIRHVPKGLVTAIFHAYEPGPATPLCIFPIDDSYWDYWLDYYKWKTCGIGLHRHMRLVPPSQPKTRLKRAQVSMAATEPELRRGWWNHDNRNWRVRYNHTPDELRKIAKTYAKRMQM